MKGGAKRRVTAKLSKDQIQEVKDSKLQNFSYKSKLLQCFSTSENEEISRLAQKFGVDVEHIEKIWKLDETQNPDVEKNSDGEHKTKSSKCEQDGCMTQTTFEPPLCSYSPSLGGASNSARTMYTSLKFWGPANQFSTLQDLGGGHSPTDPMESSSVRRRSPPFQASEFRSSPSAVSPRLPPAVCDSTRSTGASHPAEGSKPSYLLSLVGGRDPVQPRHRRGRLVISGREGESTAETGPEGDRGGSPAIRHARGGGGTPPSARPAASPTLCPRPPRSLPACFSSPSPPSSRPLACREPPPLLERSPPRIPAATAAWGGWGGWGFHPPPFYGGHPQGDLPPLSARPAGPWWSIEGAPFHPPPRPRRRSWTGPPPASVWLPDHPVLTAPARPRAPDGQGYHTSYPHPHLNFHQAHFEGGRVEHDSESREQQQQQQQQQQQKEDEQQRQLRASLRLGSTASGQETSQDAVCSPPASADGDDEVHDALVGEGAVDAPARRSGLTAVERAGGGGGGGSSPGVEDAADSEDPFHDDYQYW